MEQSTINQNDTYSLKQSVFYIRVFLYKSSDTVILTATGCKCCRTHPLSADMKNETNIFLSVYSLFDVLSDRS
jgi:hypothetical protein